MPRFSRGFGGLSGAKRKLNHKQGGYFLLGVFSDRFAIKAEVVGEFVKKIWFYSFVCILAFKVEATCPTFLHAAAKLPKAMMEFIQSMGASAQVVEMGDGLGRASMQLFGDRDRFEHLRLVTQHDLPFSFAGSSDTDHSTLHSIVGFTAPEWVLLQNSFQVPFPDGCIYEKGALHCKVPSVRLEAVFKDFFAQILKKRESFQFQPIPLSRRLAGSVDVFFDPEQELGTLSSQDASPIPYLKNIFRVIREGGRAFLPVSSAYLRHRNYYYLGSRIPFFDYLMRECPEEVSVSRDPEPLVQISKTDQRCLQRALSQTVPSYSASGRLTLYPIR